MASLVGSGSLLGSELAGASLAGMVTMEDEGYSLLTMRSYMKPKYVTFNFDLPVLIVSSLIFLILIMWFDVMRLAFEYCLINTTRTLNLVLSYLTFALVITFLFGGAIILIMKYWIKN